MSQLNKTTDGGIAQFSTNDQTITFIENEEKKEYEVVVDATGEIRGLPEDLENQLKRSHFNVEQIKQHPESVLEVINFKSKGGFR